MKKKIPIPTVSILIPTLNEAHIIKKLVEDCYSIPNIHMEVLVIIDSKTTQQTLVNVRKTKAKVIDVGESYGKGSAIHRAIPYISGDYTIQIDADYQFIPQEIPKLLAPLLAGYDIALGTRYQNGSDIEKGSVTTFKRIGSYGLSSITSFFARQAITDVMAGFKGFKTPVLRKLNPQVNHFGYEAELVIKAAKLHYSIKNVPISYRKRTEGISNVANIKHGFLVLHTILSVGFNKIDKQGK